jgi:hypothetical protein
VLQQWLGRRDDLSASSVDDRADTNEIIASLMGQIDDIESIAYGPDPTVQRVLNVLAERQRRIYRL